MLLNYAVIIIFAGLCIYVISNVIRASQIRSKPNLAPDLRKEPIVFQTQDVKFKIKWYPMLRLGQNTIFMVYYIEKQQLIITQEGIILSAVISGKEQADRFYYFDTTGINADAIKYNVVNVLGSWKEKGNQLFLKTEESGNFLPRYEMIKFDKCPEELISIVKQKIEQGEFKEE